MKLDWFTLSPASSLLDQLALLTVEARKVVDGNVDATIQGRYFGDSLSPEQKRTLQNLAIQSVIEKMSPLIKRLGEEFGITIYDDKDSAIFMIHDLENMYQRRLDQAAADLPAS